MQRTAETIVIENLDCVNVKIDKQLLKQALPVLEKYGFQLTHALHMFLDQVVREGGIPRGMVKPPKCLEDMTKEEFDIEMQKAYDSIAAGRTFSEEEVFERLHRLYGI